MNNNGRLKTLLTGLFLAAVYAYSRYNGGSAPMPSSPTIAVDPSTPSLSPSQAPSQTPKWQNTPEPRAPQSQLPETDSRDAQPPQKTQPDQPSATVPASPQHRTDREQPNVQPRDSGNGSRRDLSQDEKRHGHTLQRHVGRTDEQLLERLKAETDISSASTYTDRDTAERTVGLALEKNKAKIDAWLRQGPSRTNLAFDYIGDGRTQIGRSIHRGGTKPVPCYNAKIVLKSDGNSFHVLTSYPEGR